MDKKKDNYTVECKLCHSDIIIKYEGSQSLDKHLKTKKHVKMETSQKLSQSISNFVVPIEAKIETEVAKAELVCVYHNVAHGLSYNSLNCQIKLSSVLYCDSKIANKITCGTHAQQVTGYALKNNYYFSVSSDASNMGNIKTYPYAVQYFDSKYGIRKQVLDFNSDPYETSRDIFSNIIRITKNCDLKLKQITAYSADNAAVNYAIHTSVYQKLKDESNQIIKANCNCHIINNCVKKSLNSLSIDIENIILKIFNEFSSSAMTTVKLKECFDFAGIEYKDLLRHIPARWLSLLPAIDRLIFCWPAVKMYFLMKGKINVRSLYGNLFHMGLQILISMKKMNVKEKAYRKHIYILYIILCKNFTQLFYLSKMILAQY